jgi:hypothetical protein
VRKHLEEFDHAGIRVIVVTPSKPQAVASAVLELSTLCDPDRTAYRYFGLERARWSTFFRVRSVARYWRAVLAGWLPRGWERGEDLLQLGGDFILSADLRLLYAYRSADPTDRPHAAELANAARHLMA